MNDVWMVLHKTTSFSFGWINNMASRANSRFWLADFKKSPLKLLSRTLPNFTGMMYEWSFTEIPFFYFGWKILLWNFRFNDFCRSYAPWNLVPIAYWYCSLVNATPPKFLIGSLPNLLNNITIMGRCAWSRDFPVQSFLQELCPLKLSPYSILTCSLVNATPPKFLIGSLPNLVNIITIMGKCAWSRDFRVHWCLQDLCPLKLSLLHIDSAAMWKQLLLSFWLDLYETWSISWL